MRRVELALCLLAGTGLGQSPAEVAIEKEWRIRDLALNSAPIEVPESGPWMQQLEQLEGLRRRLALGRARPLESLDTEKLMSLLRSGEPNVRAAALACLRFVEVADWDAERIAQLASDPLPEVRSRLCAAVPSSVWRENLEPLLRLARSDEEEVRRAARDTLFRFEPDGSRADLIATEQERLFTNILSQEGVGAYLAETDSWVRANRTPVPIGEAVRVFEMLDPSGAALRGARALWIATLRGPLELEQARVLAAGWLDPLDPLNSTGTRKSRTQQELLLAAARRGGEPVALALVSALAQAPHTRPSIEWDDACEDYFEGLLEAAPPTWIVKQLFEMGLAETAIASFWSLVEAPAVNWNSEVVTRCLGAARSVELRVQTAETLAGAFARTGDLGARDRLLWLLGNPEVELRSIAFEALCDAPVELLPDLEEALFEAWRSSPTQTRYRYLQQLPRVALLPSFTPSLLSLGEDLRLRRAHPSILELLGMFRSEECAKRLRVWLAHDVAGLAKEASIEERRAAEIAARGGVRALHAVAGENAVDALHEALRGTLETSLDVAKTAAWSLGRTKGGRAQLPEFLADSVPTRVRVEAALALVNSRDRSEAAMAVLLDRFPACDSELRGRILAALARSEAEVSREFAFELFANPATGSGIAAQAFAVLVAHFEREASGANLAVLANAFERAETIELRLIALDGLARTGDARVGALLEAALAAERQWLPSEREAFLIALAHCTPRSLALWTALWRAPMESAKARLAKRFRGEGAAAIAFSFRGEITAIELIVRSGAWRADAEPELSRLDGRLALELGGACRNAGDEALATRFERIALVAFEGEYPDEKARFGALQTRARLWRSAESASRHTETEFFAAELHDGWVEGTISDRDLEALLGAYDPVAGVDPVARLVTSKLQARARTAAEKGDVERARELLRDARELLGFSQAARSLQESAERDLR